jgi:L-ribulose-5-phosphate 3-epimerase
MNSLPVGIYEKALPANLTWPECLRIVASAGYDFLELSVDESPEKLERLNWNRARQAELAGIIAATGVPIRTMCLSGHRKFPLGSLTDSVRRTGLDMMQKAIEFAVNTGIRIILISGYDVYYEPSNRHTEQLFLESLRLSTAWAGQAGVMLAMETMDYELTNSVHKVLGFVEKLASPWLQIYPDIGNLSAWGYDVPAELQAGTGHIVAAHVKDTVAGEFRRIPFGCGTVPFIAAFDKLADIGFQGPLVLEMWNDDADNALEIIIEARKWVTDRLAASRLGK